MKKELVKNRDLLHLGCAEDYSEGKNIHKELKEEWHRRLVSVDIIKAPHIDIVTDLNKSIPFTDGEFDIVLCMEIIEHLDSPINFLKECFRVLRPGGKIILTTPNAPSIIQFREAYRPFYEDANERPHIQYLDKHCIKRLFDRVGFKDYRIELHPAHYRRNIPMRLLQYFIPAFRSNLLATGWKK